MPDYLFGVEVPEYTPDGVFPLDADVNYRKGRKWETTAHVFSPILTHRFIRNSQALITFDLGFSVLPGDIFDDATKAGKLWSFFNDHKGRAVSFYYYDPEFWAAHAAPYRDDPESRLTHPTQATLGRYIASFEEDQLTAELFEYRLRKAQLRLSGYPG